MKFEPFIDRWPARSCVEVMQIALLFLFIMILISLPHSLAQAQQASNAHATAHGPRSVADLAERLMPAVVNISTRSLVDAKSGIPLPQVPDGSPFQEFFEDFFDQNQNKGKRKQSVQSLGSGFVIDPAGLIVTNNHVIKGADKISVKFSDGSQQDAQIVGRDSKTDLALLKVESNGDLATVSFGLDRDVRVGDWVMAIGKPVWSWWVGLRRDRVCPQPGHQYRTL